MSTEFKKIRIFVSSPNDVQLERAQLSKVVEELNKTISVFAPEKQIILELIKWETDVHPGLGNNPQEVVNEQIGQYDIFIGIIWKRLGTPTNVAQSGTEEEFQQAYKVWQNNKLFPVLFYFCEEPFALPQTIEEADQILKAVKFKLELSTKGILGVYQDHKSFADVVRPHLLSVISKMLIKSPEQLWAQTNYFNQTVTETGKFQSWQRIQELVKEYEEIRRTMESGDARTRKMEIVFSKMRSLAVSIQPMLKELIKGYVSGERLAAVAVLEAMPNLEYLAWLSDSIKVEKPFLGYHAALALLAAVRTFGKVKKDELLLVIKSAKDVLQKNSGNSTDRIKILVDAENELNTL